MYNQEYYICVTPFFPSKDRWQGAYIFDQVKAISRNSQYEVIVFKTCGIGESTEDYDIDGIHVNVIKPLLMPSYFLNGLTEGIVGRQFNKILHNKGIHLSQIKYIHCHTVSHSAFGFGVKKQNPLSKVIIQFHDLDPLTLRNGFWADKKWNRRFRAKKSISALNRADLLLCISEHVKDVINSFPQSRENEVYQPAIDMMLHLSDFSKIDHKKMYVLNNGVDLRLFHIKPNNDGFFRIGCIANFQELKDHRTLIEAFNILIARGYRNIRLSLLGSGETKNDIEKYVNEHNLSNYVEWPSEVQHDELANYYNTLDLFVLPSIYEGFGCVYTEAYASGVPFMCCKGQGASELIADEEADKWLTECRNPKMLASMIERQYRERNIQHLIKPIDIDILIQEYLSFLKTI